MRTFTHTRTSLAGALTAAAILFSGCGNSDSFVFTNQVNQNQPVQPPAPPVASNDAFQALGNATLNQAAPGVLANDTVNGADISGFDTVGSQGGAITLNADGSFTYSPVIGFVGSETFSYTLNNETGSSTATVTLTSTGFGRFVDNSAASNGSGTQASPFDNLQDAIDAAQSGDTIYVARGNGTDDGQDGAINLPEGVKLIGEGTGLILGQTIEPAGDAPVIRGPITCGGDNLIQGLTIDGESAVDNLIIIDGEQNVTINQNTLQNPTLEHVVGTNVSGTLAITRNTLQNPPDTDEHYIEIRNTDTAATIQVDDNTYLNEADNDVYTSLCIYLFGNSPVVASFSGNTVTGAPNGNYKDGLYFENEGSGTCTLTCNDNTFDNVVDNPLEVHAYEGQVVNTTFTGNTITNSYDGIKGDFGGSTWTLSGNVFTNCENPIDLEFGGDGTVVIDNNNITGAINDGIYVDDDNANADGKIAIRNNTITDSGTNSVRINLNEADSSACLDITGNTVNDNMFFDEQGSGTTAINIERRDAGADGGPLNGAGVNTFNNGAQPVYNAGTINSVAAGFCAIP